MYRNAYQLVLIYKFKSFKISYLEFKVRTNLVARVNVPPFCINKFQQTVSLYVLTTLVLAPNSQNVQYINDSLKAFLVCVSNKNQLTYRLLYLFIQRPFTSTVVMLVDSIVSEVTGGFAPVICWHRGFVSSGFALF